MTGDAQAEAERLLTDYASAPHPARRDALVAALAAAIKVQHYLPDVGWGPAHEAYGELDAALSALRARTGEET